MRIRMFLLGALLAAAALIPRPAHATSITFTADTGLVSTDFTSQLLVPPIPRFNPLLGTLTSVTVNTTAWLVTNFQIENLSPTAAPGISTAVSGTVTVNGPNALSHVVPLGSSFGPLALAGFDGALDFAGPSGFSALGVTVSGSAGPTVYTSAAAKAPFIGLGAVVPPYTADTLTSWSGSGVNANNAIVRTTLARAKVDVTYNYTKTPEPGSLALLGIGLVPVLRRRKRSQA